jgi:hypothetical protein
MPCAFR